MESFLRSNTPTCALLQRLSIFFFQAEDGIRDYKVTGVQTCALPIYGDPLLGRVIDGRYRIRAQLGAGGMGAVYDGEHIEIQKQVAVKVLRAVFGRDEEIGRASCRERV